LFFEHEIMKVAAGAVESCSAAPRYDLARELLREFGSLRFPAHGWSMIPTIWPGETVMVEAVETPQLEVGEIVLTESQGALRAHRLVAKPDTSDNQTWITKGDTMPVNDSPVFEKEILGRVSHVVREGKCIAVPRQRSKLNLLAAQIMRRSFPVARALLYLRNRWRGDIQVPQKSILPCQN
jgi:hypothetical protein